VAVWMLLNEFAHGGLERVHHSAETAQDWRDFVFPIGWAAAARSIGRDVAALVGDDPTALQRLQAALLIPMELQLINETGWHLSPETLALQIHAALRTDHS
jgi:hypothetical protein